MSMMMDTPAILKDVLLPYQQAWVEDNARFKIGMWSRQTGKSFATAAEAVAGCLLRPKEMWVVLSAGERQAIEWMAKARQWAEALKLGIDNYDEIRGTADAVMTRAEIRFDNGSRILAIPANPDTARGYSANLILDEFAIHERPFDIWAAIYPSITNPLSGQKVLRIVSTPKGRGNKFADLWEHNSNYSKHKITILDAKAQGLPIDVDMLKQGVDDPDIWSQEYMCEFVDNSAILLPYELIGACEVERTQDDTASPLYIGMDIGRQKDLSVIVIGQKVGDVMHIVRVETLTRMPFADQLQTLCNINSNRVQRICIDSTGIGAMLAEEARRKIGSKVEGVNFTASSKAEMYSRMRRTFEDRTIRVASDRELREDLHAVQRNVSTGGNVTYSAPRNADGHSDRAAALALCLHAAGSKHDPNFIPRIFKRAKPYASRRIGQC